MSTKQIEALKLALDALEESLEYVEEEAENAQRLYGQYPTRQARIQGLKDDARKHMDAITAIRAALAEQPAQQQEPQPPYEFERYVAGSLRAQGVRVERATTLADAMRIAAKICPPANPPSAPTVLVYTSPPASKPWVGLTDEDVYPLANEHLRYQSEGYEVSGIYDLSRAIEAKLREKNIG